MLFLRTATVVFILLLAQISWAQVSEFKLANGLTVIVQPDKRAPTAVHMLWVRVGSMDEVDGASGVAHVLEHMMFKGTPTVKSGDFSRRVAALGGQENATTSKDYTNYFQQIPSNRLEDVMRLEADRFGNNQWVDDEFAKEIEVVKEERRMRTEDVPRALFGERQAAEIYAVSPYRRPVVGWMRDLDAMTPNVARDFFKHWYVPANAVVVVAGDVDLAQTKQWAEKYYGAVPVRSVPERQSTIEPVQTSLKRFEFKVPAEQALVSLAFKVPSLLPETLGSTQLEKENKIDIAPDDAFSLTMLAAVMNGTRLKKALTQGENAVADSASVVYSLIGRSKPQLFSLQGVPAKDKTVEQVEAALREQISLIAKNGVSAAELQRVKTQWVASLVYDKDSVMNKAFGLGWAWVQGLPFDVDERLIAKMRLVTSAHVQAVASKYFSDDQLTVGILVPQPIDKTRKSRAATAGARH